MFNQLFIVVALLIAASFGLNVTSNKQREYQKPPPICCPEQCGNAYDGCMYLCAEHGQGPHTCPCWVNCGETMFKCVKRCKEYQCK
ncbi:hypothetical protein niasHS_008497 [Heterodera schachtii]|uniref:Uncharacterized protein n=1 Tax=Heterodera schachtii TaxID=97005 RepID=A0ABD2JEW7_HETSC